MHHKFDLFSDYFALRDNVATRIDPRPKVILALTLIVAIVLSHQFVLPLVAAGGCVMVMLLLGIPATLLAMRLLAPLGIASVICLLRPFFVAGDPILSLSIAGWTLTASWAGVIDGLLIASRVLGAVSTMILLSMTTPAHRIFAVLSWAHLPRTLVETAMLMYRYIFTLLRHTSDAISAARIRLGFSSGRRALSSMGMVAGAVLTRSIRQAERTHEAMTCRGYQGEIPLGHLQKLTPRQILGTVAGPACVVSLYLCLEFYL